MKNREFLTDEQVEKEVERLTNSDNVKLARKYERLKYKRRQYLYSLRDLEKKGEKLAAAGITYDMLDDAEVYGVAEGVIKGED